MAGFLPTRRLRRANYVHILFEGRVDYNLSSSAAAEWFERVQAPSKTLVWFEHTGYEVTIEAPGKTLVCAPQPMNEPAGAT